MIKGIDVSSWQGNIDFGKVKASGIDFVIIRAGYGREVSQIDKCFVQNYNAAKVAGLDVGAYWYSYADSAEDAVKEAKACMEVIKGKKFEYPIYFDLEKLLRQYHQGFLRRTGEERLSCRTVLLHILSEQLHLKFSSRKVCTLGRTV